MAFPPLAPSLDCTRDFARRGYGRPSRPSPERAGDRQVSCSRWAEAGSARPQPRRGTRVYCLLLGGGSRGKPHFPVLFGGPAQALDGSAPALFFQPTLARLRRRAGGDAAPRHSQRLAELRDEAVEGELTVAPLAALVLSN